MIKAMMTVLLASVCSTAALASPSSESQATSHEAHAAHASSHDATVVSPDGKRWPTDASLRTGMSRIQAAVDDSATGAPLSRERSVALARTIEQNVAYIIEHCKLPPQADAALHVLIARMLTASHQLKNDSSPDTAVADVRSVLDEYRGAFDTSPTAESHRH